LTSFGPQFKTERTNFLTFVPFLVRSLTGYLPRRPHGSKKKNWSDV